MTATETLPPGPPARPTDPDPPTSSRPHRAARVEDAFNRAVARRLWARGWRTRIEPYVGYGAPGWVRVMARTVLSPPEPLDGRSSARAPEDEPARTVRGWRSLATAQVPGAVVEVRAGGARAPGDVGPRRLHRHHRRLRPRARMARRRADRAERHAWWRASGWSPPTRGSGWSATSTTPSS